MATFRSWTPRELADRICETVGKPRSPQWSHFNAALVPTEAAPYALVVGAGFSYGVVPLVRELMHETIGNYYYPDQDQSSMPRDRGTARTDSAAFWEEVNAAAERAGQDAIAVDASGLPADPGSAYQTLFTYRLVNELFAQAPKRAISWVESIAQRRRRATSNESTMPATRANVGERFLKGFLRYVLDPGSESGYGSTGRVGLNPAHIYLGALLEAQQLGRIGLFCRTVLTTNFDTLLQNALQMVNLLYVVTDDPPSPMELQEEEAAIQLVYLHGSILRHNPASSTAEVGGLATRNGEALESYLRSRDVIAVGYSGWEDAMMVALRRLRSGDRRLYWCDVLDQPAPHVADLLESWGERAAYINLGAAGADGFLRALYERLVVDGRGEDPARRYQKWNALRDLPG
jgi:hypothetical protein